MAQTGKPKNLIKILFGSAKAIAVLVTAVFAYPICIICFFASISETREPEWYFHSAFYTVFCVFLVAFAIVMYATIYLERLIFRTK